MTTSLTSLSPTWVGSPNFAKGRKRAISAVVIHITEGSEASVDSWFRSTKSEVSAHYMVTRDGRLKQYVREEDTAWHAGRVFRPTWLGLIPDANPNSYTIGVEHEAAGASSEWPDAMYERSSILLAEIHVRWGVELDRLHVVGHREIRADKSCPGATVDMDRLITVARALVGLL
jgi:N-acetylmuramoyl-L-alanine amidase